MKHCAIFTVVVILVTFGTAQTPTQPVQYPPGDTLYFNHPEIEQITKLNTEALENFNEPSLLQESKVNPNSRVYRLIWIGALAFESPIVVRLNVNADGTGLLTQKIRDRRDGPGGKIQVKTRTISKEKMERFLSRVQKLDFTNQPTQDPNLPGVDGSDWLVESVGNGSYKVFRRWSPRKGPIRKIGFMLSRLAGVKLIPEYDR